MIGPDPLSSSQVIVVDTDVVSFLFKDDSRAAWYKPHLVGRVPLISAQTRAELYRWPHESKWGRARTAALDAFVSSLFTVEYPTDQVCRICGELMARARQRGRPLPAGDAWQAATAVTLEVPLMTHNASNYAGVPQLALVTWSSR